MTASIVYLDSSALLKLIFDEPESDPLVTFLGGWPERVASALARVEVLRIVRRVGDPATERQARRVLKAVNLVRIDDGIVDGAAMLAPSGLRSLDAIHLATALAFGHDLAGMVVYDRRLTEAAREHGLTVWSPV